MTFLAWLYPEMTGREMAWAIGYIVGLVAMWMYYRENRRLRFIVAATACPEPELHRLAMQRLARAARAYVAARRAVQAVTAGDLFSGKHARDLEAQEDATVNLYRAAHDYAAASDNVQLRQPEKP